jgi:hypothetical protein
MPTKSFRGKLADGLQQRIDLQTNNGMTGYRIVKFQIIDSVPGNAPGAVDPELVCKIYKTIQSAVDGVVDFSDNRLLAVAYYQGGNLSTETNSSTIIFDNEVFNQNIFVTMNEGAGGTALGNYYIELEQIKLDLNEQTVATLKDIRNSKVPS